MNVKKMCICDFKYGGTSIDSGLSMGDLVWLSEVRLFSGYHAEFHEVHGLLQRSRSLALYVWISLWFSVCITRSALFSKSLPRRSHICLLGVDREVADKVEPPLSTSVSPAKRSQGFGVDSYWHNTRGHGHGH